MSLFTPGRQRLCPEHIHGHEPNFKFSKDKVVPFTPRELPLSTWLLLLHVPWDPRSPPFFRTVFCFYPQLPPSLPLSLCPGPFLLVQNSVSSRSHPNIHIPTPSTPQALAIQVCYLCGCHADWAVLGVGNEVKGAAETRGVLPPPWSPGTRSHWTAHLLRRA